MTLLVPLSAARRLSVLPLPLGSATTWSPTTGYRIHPALDVAAAHVVLTPNARILSTPAGLTVAEEAAALALARATMLRTP